MITLRRRLPSRRALGVIAVALAALAPAAGAARPALPRLRSPVGDARLEGAFQMEGTVVRARRVPGELRGQHVLRLWTFAPTCATGICATIRLQRERPGPVREELTLQRISPGVYGGRGAFRVALSCRGHVYPGASYVPYRIVVAVTALQPQQSGPTATAIAALYDNRVRTDATPCPLGPSRDAVSYTGTPATPAPSP